MNNNVHNQQGFTIVEMLVTIIVSSMFIILFFQLYLVLESQRIQVARQAKASDVAYSNLRKMTTRPANLTASLCDNNMDTAANPNAAGLLLGDQTNTTTGSTYGFFAEPTSVTQSLGASTTQELRVFAPYGCANFTNSPLKIVSTVTFGNGDKVTHASFIQ